MIKVLIIEDSHFLGLALKKIVEADPIISVVGISNFADEAVEKVELLEPDVILLDIEVPQGGALDILYSVMKDHPVPTIVIGPESDLGKKEMINAFSYGALDFLIRPRNFLEIETIADELIRLIKVAASVEIKKLIRKPAKASRRAPKSSDKLVVIGASSGGVIALEEVLTKLPCDFPAAVLVVQHMPAGFTKTFAERLNSLSRIPIEEAKDGGMLAAGRVFIAPGGYNLEVCVKGKHLFTQLNKKHTTIKPCIDIALKSAAVACGKSVIAVILTGMGHDGTEGVRWVKKNGGKAIAQDEASSLIFGMPKSVIDAGDADYVVGLHEITDKIVEIL
jgi:two-component system chemotaxis response regulator CheB